MAYIDKMHLEKKDIPAFYEYLKSIDKDFQEYFSNAESILDYTYYYRYSTPELLAEWIDGAELPVSNFPCIIDRWLAHREDLPDIIRKQLEEQYGEGYSKGFSNCDIFTEPIYKERKEKLSHKFRVKKWTKCKGRRRNKAMTYWAIDPKGYWHYYIDEQKFYEYEYITPDLLGKDYWIGASEIEFKSIKAVFKYLRKHGFPKGTVIEIYNWRYWISRLEIEFV